MDELDKWIDHRRKIASIYNENLKDVKGVRLTIPPNEVYHSYYKYYFFIETDKFSITRNELINKINEKNIFCQVGSCSEIYKENALKEYAPNEDLLVAKELFETSILLKCDPCISKDYALECITKIRKILYKYINMN